MRAIEQSVELAESGEAVWRAFVHMARGEILASDPNGEPGVAEHCYERALAIARDQSARSNELRAATRLARLWRDQDKLAEARDLLRPIYDRFTEGFDTPDLEDAKTLLDQLG